MFKNSPSFISKNTHRYISRSSQFQSILRGTIYPKIVSSSIGPTKRPTRPPFRFSRRLLPLQPPPPISTFHLSRFLFSRLCESQQPAKAQSSSRAEHFPMGLHQGTMTFRKRNAVSASIFSFLFFFFPSFPPFGGQSASARRNCSKRGPLLGPPPWIPSLERGSCGRSGLPRKGARFEDLRGSKGLKSNTCKGDSERRSEEGRRGREGEGLAIECNGEVDRGPS